MEIIPAILTSEAYEAKKMLQEVKKDGRFGKVQIDFVDGEYNNNLTIKPEDVDLTPFLEMEFDAHLMVTEKNLLKYKLQAVKVGFDRIIVQVESISRPEEFYGLALDIHSPVLAIEKYLPRLNVVVVMGVEPGFGGQNMSDKVFEKVRRLSYLRNLGDLRYKVCVDGGVEKEMLEELEKAGADEVAVGVKRLLEW
jgi:ribulose-phosphate 3-epimerase